MREGRGGGPRRAEGYHNESVIFACLIRGVSLVYLETILYDSVQTLAYFLNKSSLLIGVGERRGEYSAEF